MLSEFTEWQMAMFIGRILAATFKECPLLVGEWISKIEPVAENSQPSPVGKD